MKLNGAWNQIKRTSGSWTKQTQLLSWLHRAISWQFFFSRSRNLVWKIQQFSFHMKAEDIQELQIFLQPCKSYTYSTTYTRNVDTLCSERQTKDSQDFCTRTRLVERKKWILALVSKSTIKKWLNLTQYNSMGEVTSGMYESNNAVKKLLFSADYMN